MNYVGRAIWVSMVYLVTDVSVSVMSLGFGYNFQFDKLRIRGSFYGAYDYCSSLTDFVVLMLIRVSFVIGTVIGIIWQRKTIEQAKKNAQSCKTAVFPVLVAMQVYSPIKLLAVSEVEPNLKLCGFWLSFTWNLLACMGLFVIWNKIYCSSSESSENVRERREDEEELLAADSNPTQGESDAKSDGDRNTYAHTMRVIRYCKKEWVYYSMAFLFLFIYSGANIFIPYYTGQVIANVFASKSYEQLLRCVVIITALSIIVGIFGGFRGCCFMYANSRVAREMRGGLFRSLVRQDIAFFDTNKTGEVMSRLTTDCQTVSDLVSNNVNIFLRNMVMMIGSFVVMVSMSWRLTLLTFVATPVIMLVAKLYGVYYDDLSERNQKSLARGNEMADEVLSSMRTVRSFANEEAEADRYWDFLTETLAIMRTKSLAHIGYIFANEALNKLTLVAVLWYGGHLVLTDRMSSDALITFLLYELQLAENLYVLDFLNKLSGLYDRQYGKWMSVMWTTLMTAVGASRKVFEYMDRQPVVKNDGKYTATKLNGKIEFKDVCFSYPSRPDNQVLKKLSFTVEPGEIVALVGPSGGGKSSCISLLEHFYEAVDGEILLDDIPLADYAHKYLHSKIALVSQEPVLFGCSVRENIAYGLENVTDEEVERVAKMANAHDFIVDSKDGYKTSVGEKGAQISGGQKQRIAIARALVREPAVLLLDEATSALDAESEHLVQEAIYRNLRGHTVLLIAHRLSTVEKADRILVLHKGQLIQIGNHHQLLHQSDGLYKQLVHRQLLLGGTVSDDKLENSGEENSDLVKCDRSDAVDFQTIQSTSDANFRSPLGSPITSSLTSDNSQI